MEGWIKLHRKMLEWEWYDEPNTFRLFIHCLLKANHEDNSWRGITIKRGQFVTSYDKLADELSLTPMKVRTSLKKLNLTNEITNESNRQYTIIQVVNYDKYQLVTNEITDEQQTDNKRITNEQQTDNKRITTNKNEKNYKNEENDKNEKNIINSSNEEEEAEALKVKKILDVYNQKAETCSFPKCQKLTEQRKKSVKARIKDYGLAKCEEAVEVASASDFLNGKNDRSWILNFDWLFNPNNFVKVIEGKYNNKTQVQTTIINDKTRTQSTTDNNDGPILRMADYLAKQRVEREKAEREKQERLKRINQ